MILARAGFYVIHPDEFGLLFDLLSLGLFVIFIAGQIFWIKRIIDVAAHLIPSHIGRTRLAVVVALIYLFVYTSSYPGIQSTNDHIFRTGYDRPLTVVTEALFWWWFVGSMLAFFLVLVFGAGDYATRAITWTYTKIRDTSRQHASAEISTPASPSRRRFLRQSAVLVSATPFLAAGYGLLYGRHDVEVVRQRVRLARLPKGFDGFRIAQLSDIHMGPFCAADYIRRCIAITNGLKPDLIALTGTAKVLAWLGISLGAWPFVAWATGIFLPGPFTSPYWNATAVSTAFWFLVVGVFLLVSPLPQNGVEPAGEPFHRS